MSSMSLSLASYLFWLSVMDLYVRGWQILCKVPFVIKVMLLGTGRLLSGLIKRWVSQGWSLGLPTGASCL